jgi:2-dehydropantoate 2-reductase
MIGRMRFVVVGAGAIGAYVGACLARGGADVTLIARGPHLQAMAEHGVRVHSPAGDFEAHPAATDDMAAVAGADVVLLGLKAYSLPELAPVIGPLLAPGAIVMAAQNGIPWWYFQGHGGGLDGRTLESVDPGGGITAAFPARRVLGSVVYCATELEAPGVVRHLEGTRFSIGTPDGDRTERCDQVAQAFRAGGLRAPFDPNLRQQIWLKLVGNAALNPLTAVTGATLGALASSPHATGLARRVMEECAAVAAALGVELPLTIERRLEAAIGVGDHKTSMLQDLEAGKPLELDCMTGAVVEIAGMVGVPVPETRVLDSLTRAVAELRLANRGQAPSQPRDGA